MKTPAAESLAFIIFLICVFSVPLFAQKRECANPSIEINIPAVGANEVVYYSKTRKVKRMLGQITDSTGQGLEAIIEIFVVKSFGKSDENPGDIISDDAPVNRYLTNENGEFCIENLPKGKYVLRIGTRRFAFNFALFKISLSNYGSSKPLKFDLTPGT